MNDPASLIKQLSIIRNRYGKNIAARKLYLLTTLDREKLIGKKEITGYYDLLLFLIAYPDNRKVYERALRSLKQLERYIQSHQHIKEKLFNSGISYTKLCAAFGFDIVKWIKEKFPDSIRIRSFEADTGQISSVLSAVLPKIESEILQDANETWRSWLKKTGNKGEDVLQQLLSIFDEADLRPEVRDELWAALGVNVEVDLPAHPCLPDKLVTPFFHRSLIPKKNARKQADGIPQKANLNNEDANRIIDGARMMLVQHFREIDPISFTAPEFIQYYRLPRGYSIALMGMKPERRNPIDCYYGYMLFKNGLPLAYAGSWIWFDSGRIGLNVFPAFRSGEAQYVFEQILHVHRRVFRLRRFSVDPYQIGKENSEGIHSGAFWTYYRAGFRPIKKEQRLLAEAEAEKIKSVPGYRSAHHVLKKLADSRLERMLQKKAFHYDATDCSRAFAALLQLKYNNHRKIIMDSSFRKMITLLKIKNPHEPAINHVVKNWAVLLAENERPFNMRLKQTLKKLMELKAYGREEEYIRLLQKTTELKIIVERLLKQYAAVLK